MTSSSISVSNTIRRAIEHFTQSLVILPIDQPIDSTLENAMVAEHELKLIFAGARQLEVEDSYLGLIDVFKLHPAARRTRRCANQSAYGLSERHILPLRPRLQRPDLAPSTVFDLEVFQHHWQLFTHSVLGKMKPQDWNNVLAAGGSVLACLMAPLQSHSSDRKLNQYFQSSVYASSNIDLFLWGLTSHEAEIKMQDIFKAVCAAAPWPVTCVRRAKTVTIHTTYPYRPVQIVLRLYHSPAEILAGFDVDSSCCAYDGAKVYVNPRALTALVRQANTIDIARCSPSYEFKLARYAQRGFQIYIPSLNRNSVKPWVYDGDMRSFPGGLARLLVMEAVLTKPHLYTYLRNPFDPVFLTSNYDVDLGWAPIPYGPNWDAKEVKAKVMEKDAWVNSPSNPLSNGHRHIFIVGRMKKCLWPSCEDCDRLGDAENPNPYIQNSNLYINGPVQYGIPQITVSEVHEVTYYRFIKTGSDLQSDVDTLESWAAEAYRDRDDMAHIPFEDRPTVIVKDYSDSDGDSDLNSEYTDTVSHFSTEFHLD